MSIAARERAWAVGVGLAAAAYFSLGIGLTLEWSDEGQIVYPAWRVARGALPYRDFLHLYGPALFLTNGALLHSFGADLRVLRTALVVVKALAIALAYVAARLLAPRPFALAAAALLTAIWGAPIWVFNAPYANHYAMALVLAGLVCVAGLPQRRLAPSVLAGLFCGAAATFKQTAGLFAYIGVGLALLQRTAEDASDAPAARDVVVRLVRLGFLAVSGGLATVYLAPANSVGNALALASPLAAVLAVSAIRELRSRGGPDYRRGALQLTAASAGFATPLVACAVFFAAHGALRELLFNTGTGLPHLVHWFDPIAMPPARAWVLAITTVAGCALLTSQRRGGRSLALIALGASGALVAVALSRGDAPNLALRGLTILLFGSAWWGVAAAFAARLPRGLAAVVGEAEHVRALEILGLASVTGVLLLYPAADVPHVLMAWPLFTPMVAHLLWRWWTAAARGVESRGRFALGAVAAVLIAALAAPFAGDLVLQRARPVQSPNLARAGGVAIVDATSAEAAHVLDYLARQPSGPILVLSDQQMMYFLAGRDSVVAPYEFVLYLVGAGVIRDADAHQLLGDAEFAGEVAKQRPLIIDRAGPMATRLRRAYPETARTLADRYQPAFQAGSYEVLEWKN